MDKILFWVLGVCIVGLFAMNIYSVAIDIPAKEAELQQCFEDDYTVTAKGVEITVLPEDWQRWSYVIDHEAKTVKFLEIRPNARLLFVR